MSPQELLLQFVRNELQMARTMLQVAATEMAHPADPKHAEQAIARACAAIKEARRFLPKLEVSDAERTNIEAELSSLEKSAQDQPPQP